MIRVNGKVVNPSSIADLWKLKGKEWEIVERMHTNTTIYEYSSIAQLDFEVKLRDKITQAATLLYHSGLRFSVFRKSECNTRYWDRTEEGGFRKHNQASSFDAIDDIYQNGRKYATECATAIIILYYKAIAELFGSALFDKVFNSIYLMNWKELDENLGIRTHRLVPEPLPGDCLYFKNPEVNPLTAHWQGENAIYFGGDKYYGHGIGLTSAQGIIDKLNQNRKSGATQSAYLLNSATRLSPKRLFQIAQPIYPFGIGA